MDFILKMVHPVNVDETDIQVMLEEEVNNGTQFQNFTSQAAWSISVGGQSTTSLSTTTSTS